MTDHLTVRTSDAGWFTALAKAYKDRRGVLVVDDAGVGIDPQGQTLLQMGLHARLSSGEWSAALVGVGMTLAGVALVLAAVLDPEPTSKLGLLVGGGLFLAATGGLSAVAVLTRRRPPTVRITKEGMVVEW